ncbi:S41 family peptidase [Labilibaculum sp. DW002]|uniref:S41 family peptidase n=1 Tax=Paralabilibaculum antarcticum TaxID=2912572 RepID=A0ABT5VVL8_9BACT|nr:S41 family peptidase [Labilibaculum sp. DW002]MDE5419468.1 S41 family peptidase [Labilibaculum sp. DW002]
MSSKKIFLRNVVSVCLVVLFTHVGSLQAQSVKNQAIKYQNLLALIDAFYVDTVSLERLTEDAVVKVLAELDPHSIYISKDEIKEMNEPLQGSFSGIGIQFNILRDTLMVVATIPGGPSEKVGLRAGDRILKIDDENVAAIGLKNNDVRKKLRGDKGTIVELIVKRKREKDLIDFVITRDKIPIHSLDAAYMIDNKIGYIKLNRFAATTSEEFLEALIKLKGENMQDMIIDLRGNGGGYMQAAIEIVDQLFESEQLIVYTKGLTTPRRESVSTTKGIFKEGKVVVLIDEGSASASEIVSGAIQDWDRGVILGRRSFGKGLVQRQFPLSDGSMIRLTTAHYYTPTGRCIQKTYEKGLENYHLDILKRYQSGEMISADSIQFADSLKYNTLVKNRVVYGGGGIMPDIFVPIDTTANFKYFNLLVRKNVVYPFVVNYMDENLPKLRKKYPAFEDFAKKFEVSEEMLTTIVEMGEKEGIEKTEEDYNAVVDDLKLHVKALLARDLWKSSEYYKIVNKDNDFIKKAVEVLKNKEVYQKELANE